MSQVGKAFYIWERRSKDHTQQKKNRLELLLVSGAKTQDIDESLNL